ncbi:MAG TPA: hypothetical protein VHM26_04685 [Chitinophagaceae bacterium]|nr:hypothetical protein [Chitinophagaceae bacterium]
MNEDILGNYHFYSEGPFGIIHKAVSYRRMHGNLFNLMFGDWNDLKQLPDDTARTSNNDHKKILMTVAYTVLMLLDRYPNAFVVAAGNTPGQDKIVPDSYKQ